MQHIARAQVVGFVEASALRRVQAAAPPQAHRPGHVSNAGTRAAATRRHPLRPAGAARRLGARLADGWLSPRFLAAPSTAVVAGYEMLADGVLPSNSWRRRRRAYLGLAIGVAIGLVLALLAGLTRAGEASIDGLVQIKRAVPTLALIPLAILWLGIGEAMKIAIIATSVLVPIYINTHAALRGIDIRYVELARSVGLTRASSSAGWPCPARCPASSPACGSRSPPAGPRWSCSSRSTPPRASAT